MSRVALLYGEEALLDEYNSHVTKKLNEKSPETKRKSTLSVDVTQEIGQMIDDIVTDDAFNTLKSLRKSTLSVGFTRGICQLVEDTATYHPFDFLIKIPAGGLFDTKKDFHRLISLLLLDIALVFDVRSPSPWQVISELRNLDITGESDSANLTVCLSIANEIRLKTYFANGGQKELFSPLLQIPDAPKQSTDDPIFRDFDEDTLVRLLSTSYDMHRRCQKFCFKYARQGKPDVSILRNPFFPSKALVMSTLYTRLQNFPKALECLKSISKNSPDYDQCLRAQGHHHTLKRDWKKAIECFETALEYSQSPSSSLLFHRDLATCLIKRFQFKKAKNKLEESMKLHDEIYGEGSETVILSSLMIDLGTLFNALEDMPSAIKWYQRAEQIQKRMKYCSDTEVIHLKTQMAFSYSRLCQNDRALDCLEKALCLSHKTIGEHNISCELLRIYQSAAAVYTNCGRYHEAFSWQERSLKLLESLYGDTMHRGKIALIADKRQ